MLESNTYGTPIQQNHGLGVYDPKDVPVEASYYRAIIGSLVYLTTSRPDIMFAACLCARFQASSKESHLVAAKRILRYLKGNQGIGLWYPMGGTFDFVAYVDSDFGCCNNDRKSATRGCQFLGGRLVSWRCKKQTFVAQSSCEAEYMAVGSYCCQVLWIQQQLRNYGMDFLDTPIRIDNKLAIDITNNIVMH
uniref:secreted RxLR effector protein 161-like n=1 Tax=Erigeron canadensis TaxID=72917 RepID=UPI001CB97EF5|nr:secreted RxLR effector protein 161-like [Erigeron canadensis]